MRRLLATLALAVSAVSLAACSERGNAQAPPRQPVVPVGVSTVEQKVVPVQITAVGNVQAYTTVNVKSQIAGQIVQVHFKEGQDVRRGQVLFTIDQRPPQAAVRQAEANVARDTAQLRQAEAALAQRRGEVAWAQANLERDLAQMENARVQDRRYRTLVEKELVSRDQYDQIRTAFVALQATVLADRAAVENAKAAVQAQEAMVENARAVIKANEAAVETARLQLAYTTISAPMDGRTGNVLGQVGTVLKGNDDTPLVVLAQVHPIYVSFGVPEVHLADVKKYRARGALRVEAAAGGQRTAAGQVTFVNNTVDPSTGMIQLKATFENADNALWPGQFVDVALTLTSDPAVVVPAQAIQAGQQGPFVFVVKPDSTVEARPVKAGRRLARETVIEQGLRPGERVVTDGQLRLVPGARVEIKPQRPS